MLGGPADLATKDLDRLAARTGDASGADVTWRLKSHSTGPSTTRPPLKCGHALPRPIRSCWRIAELPPDILHDSLACCSILVPISCQDLFFLVSIFLRSGCFTVALSVSAPIALLLSCVLGAPWAALGAAGRLVLSLSLSLSPNAPRSARLAQIFCSPSVSRHIARWRVACAKGRTAVGFRTWSKSSAANQLRVVVLSYSSVPSFPTPQLSLSRAVRPERLSGHTPTRAPIDWEKQ